MNFSFFTKLIKKIQLFVLLFFYKTLIYLIKTCVIYFPRRISISTCVMLICPQCAALTSDMEQHLTNHKVRGNLTNHKVRGNLTNHKVRGNLTNHKVWGNLTNHLTNHKVRGNLTNHKVRGNLTNHKVRDNLTNQKVCGKSDKP